MAIIDEEQNEDEQKENTETPTSFGLLTINNAYKEGKITFKEWVQLTRQWAVKVIKEYGEREESV